MAVSVRAMVLKARSVRGLFVLAHLFVCVVLWVDDALPFAQGAWKCLLYRSIVLWDMWVFRLNREQHVYSAASGGLLDDMY